MKLAVPTHLAYAWLASLVVMHCVRAAAHGKHTPGKRIVMPIVSIVAAIVLAAGILQGVDILFWASDYLSSVTYPTGCMYDVMAGKCQGERLITVAATLFCTVWLLYVFPSVTIWYCVRFGKETRKRIASRALQIMREPSAA